MFHGDVPNLPDMTTAIKRRVKFRASKAMIFQDSLCTHWMMSATKTMPISGNIRKYQEISGNFRKYQEISGNIRKCQETNNLAKAASLKERVMSSSEKLPVERSRVTWKLINIQQVKSTF